MKRQIFMFPILLLSVFLFSCKQDDDEAQTRVIGFTPTTLAFGDVEVGKNPTKELTIKNTGNAALAVTSVTVPTGYSVSPTSLTVAAGASGKVTVTFTPTAAGDVNGDLTVVSNKTSGGNTVALTGAGMAAVPTGTRVIGLTPATLAFGTVDVGDTLMKDVTIKNTGEESLDVTSITVPGGYSVAPMSLMVAAGDSATVTVTFTPTSGGAANGDLTVMSNKTSGGNTVALTGTGMAVASTPLLSIDFETDPVMTYGEIETWEENMYEYVDNPSKMGINTSNKVGKSTKGKQIYSGLAFTLPEAVTYSASTTFKMKVRADVAGPILFKIEKDADNTEEVKVDYTDMGEWQELSFDFQAMPITTFMKVALFFNYDPVAGTGGSKGEVFYFDDIVIE